MNEIVHEVKNNVVFIESKFVKNQKMIIYFDDKHENNEFTMIFDDQCKINDMNDEFDHTIVETTKMFEFEKKNENEF